MLKKIDVQQTLLFLRCKNGLTMKNLTIKMDPQQSMENKNQHADGEKIEKKS